MLFVATEHDSVYAFDADTLTQLWKTSVLGAGETPSDDRTCNQVMPEIGITSTPVIDLNQGPHGTIFVVAMSKNGGGSYLQRLHALDLTTGAEIGTPTVVTGTYTGTGTNSSGGNVTFDPKQYKDRAALLLLNGVIYTTWASHCDFDPYNGWIMGYSESTLQETSVLNITPNGTRGAIWMAGRGPAADSSGSFYLLVGNGSFNPNASNFDAQGFPIDGDYGNAFLRLLPGSTPPLKVADYLNMHDTVSESNGDVDFGSGGAMVLVDMTDGTGTMRHLAVGAGKDARIYLVDRTNMGKFSGTSTDNIYQEVTSAFSCPGGDCVFSTPAFYNGTLYYGAVNDALKAFTFSNTKLPTSASFQSSSTFGYPGITPSISANGTTNPPTNGIVWAVENNGNNLGGGAAALHAYNATNMVELYNSSKASVTFTDNKFVTPMIANGKVYIPSSNSVVVFGTH